MAENKKYRLWANGRPVEVSKEIYSCYKRMARRERYLEARDAAHGKLLYSQLDTEELSGEGMMPDRDAIPVEEVVETLLMVEKLRKCIALLLETEQDLIDALYFSNDGYGMTEREYSTKSGIPQQTINDRRRRTLCKLRKLMDK